VRALAILEAALGSEHPEVANSLENLGNVHLATGDYETAKGLYTRALAVREKVLGPEHPSVATTLVDLADVALAEHRPGDALPLARRALELREKGRVPTGLLANARFLLARALWEAPEAAGGHRARARILAEQARQDFRAVGKSKAKMLAQVDAWLADHPPE
jgi:tetratricopeptide (TPR) repeat protein